MPNTISLCMIVKDEAHIIARCLDSVKPLVDHVLVVDTGSTDNTVEVIQQWLADNHMHGIVVREPWQNFAYNRSHALRLLREGTDYTYALMIDADEVLEFDPGFDYQGFKDGLTAEVYEVQTRYNSLVYYRPTLTRNDVPVVYRGVVHEFADREGGWRSYGRTAGFWDRPIQDGARSVNGGKFEKDAAVLVAALEEGRDPDLAERYTFYAGQCFRDAENWEKALEYYLKRAEMPGGYQQEIYVSLLNSGRIAEHLKRPGLACNCYDEAVRFCPQRAEAWLSFAQLARSKTWWAMAYALSVQAAKITEPPLDCLFIESWAYNWRSEDELALAAYHMKDFALAARINRCLVERSVVPEADRERIKGNLAECERFL